MTMPSPPPPRHKSRTPGISINWPGQPSQTTTIQRALLLSIGRNGISEHSRTIIATTPKALILQSLSYNTRRELRSFNTFKVWLYRNKLTVTTSNTRRHSANVLPAEAAALAAESIEASEQRRCRSGAGAIDHAASLCCCIRCLDWTPLIGGAPAQ